ncbi:MAG: FG-GAP-like repeat-containing protein, partial [Cyclobacteriaceae bacterium]|nr:FG-GAP-like repeat-containing protein [Cyclobacteriaceae bacterium]
MKKFLTFILIVGFFSVKAQVPVISTVSTDRFYPGGSIVINGSGFNADPTQLVVWFGSTKGRVVYSTENIIEVVVPTGAHAENITVINKASKKSGKSDIKFFPVFSGNTFDPTKIEAAKVFPNVLQTYDLCSCDFNNDGLVDIALTKNNATGSSVEIYQNNSTLGNISFTLKNTVGIPAPTAFMTCGDMNNDGFPEIAVTKGGGTSGVDKKNIYVLPNVGGTVNTYSTYTLPDGLVSVHDIQLKDLNTDGLQDLIISSSQDNNLYFYMNNSAAAVSFVSTANVLPIVGIDGTFSLEVQDLNSDGRPEIIVVAKVGNAKEIEVLKNISTINKVSFDAPVVFKTEIVIEDLITGDFNNDGKLDIVTSSPLSTSKVSLLLNNSSGGNISFAAKQSFNVTGATGLDVGDIDGDGFLDLMVGNTNDVGFTLLKNNAGSGVTPMAIPGTSRTRGVSINDYDGDGKPDFAMTSYTISGASITGYALEIRRNLNCYVPRILTADATRAICVGQTIAVDVIPSPGTTFSWKLDGTEFTQGTDPFANITGFGTLTVDAITQVGTTCSTTSSNSMNFINGAGTVPGDPVPTNAGPGCIGGNIQLNVPAVVGATYSWDGPNGYTSNAQNPMLSNVQIDDAGEYIVTVKLGDCQSTAASTFVEVLSFPKFYIQSSTGNGFCEGTNSTLSVPAQVNFDYVWKKDGTTFGTNTNSVIITSAGIYTVTLTHKTLGCSFISEPQNVLTTPPPVSAVTVSNATGCVGEELIFRANPTSDPAFTVAYLWDFGDGTTSTLENPLKTYAAAGNLTATLSISYSDVASCGTTENIAISVATAIAPTITASVDPICPGQESTLAVQGTYSSITWDDATTGPSRIVSQPDIEYFANTVDANGCNGK